MQLVVSRIAKVNRVWASPWREVYRVKGDRAAVAHTQNGLAQAARAAVVGVHYCHRRSASGDHLIDGVRRAAAEYRVAAVDRRDRMGGLTKRAARDQALRLEGDTQGDIGAGRRNRNVVVVEGDRPRG